MNYWKDPHFVEMKQDKDGNFVPTFRIVIDSSEEIESPKQYIEKETNKLKKRINKYKLDKFRIEVAVPATTYEIELSPQFENCLFEKITECEKKLRTEYDPELPFFAQFSCLPGTTQDLMKAIVERYGYNTVGSEDLGKVWVILYEKYQGQFLEIFQNEVLKAKGQIEIHPIAA